MAALENPPHDSPACGPDRLSRRRARLTLIPRGPARTCTFRTGERAGLWYVNKNDVFYGDYLSRNQAIEAACFGARTVEAKGGSARVVSMPGDVPVPHQTTAAHPRAAQGRS